MDFARDRSREGRGLEAARPVAVLMMAYGGPDSLGDVEPYLLDVRGGRATPPDLVEEIRHRYAQIGGRSPLLEITRDQARALEARLNSGGETRRFRVYVGMRHWHPYIRAAMERIMGDGLREVVALCMAPHYSKMSIGAYFQRVREAQESLGADLRVHFVESWHNHPLFVRALAEKVRAGLAKFSREGQGDVSVVFTAHSLPASLVEQGDPYDDQLRETANMVAAEVGLEAGQWQFCYQSAGARQVRWLGPPIEEVISELTQAGRHSILVAPIGFVADHVEVLYDLDIEARNLAGRRGALLERTESLNTTPLFIEALAEVVRDRLHQLAILGRGN